MIAEVCRFYGWTDSHVLAMPASRFFVMLQASRRLARMERIHSCYVARSANMDRGEWLETLKWFEDFGSEDQDEKPPVVETKPKPKPLNREQEALIVMRAFAKDRRIDRTVKK